MTLIVCTMESQKFDISSINMTFTIINYCSYSKGGEGGRNGSENIYTQAKCYIFPC